jgi:hypothetical protein
MGTTDDIVELRRILNNVLDAWDEFNKLPSASDLFSSYTRHMFAYCRTLDFSRYERCREDLDNYCEKMGWSNAQGKAVENLIAKRRWLYRRYLSSLSKQLFWENKFWRLGRWLSERKRIESDTYFEQWSKMGEDFMVC